MKKANWITPQTDKISRKKLDKPQSEPKGEIK